ncbi:MetQ/NlpA family ABC transporter substrate-binding protein [Pseudalkalibacillus salsuginis]|uniref:MetQ/NlpA family ABC transporter substrate-binding protein n=1 Tax=Pseudalkalibacillus salsuginis TaxID=2910972 RepID=UPI001F1E81BB|nr:MetQ/NlpA family ABC transporter substrate-binding protein [Pseudalkalibacillus salsuginis]MCF6410401.1 MetQ/NlpA family ABC transporter substrate-binding protein [Pseudalkalibacillus salsuginis]
MKRIIILLTTVFIISVLAACGNSNSGGDEKELVVGASNVPHAEILEEAEPLLEEKGIKLEIEKLQDYVTPNKMLAAGELDANFFQHVPYMETQMKDNKSYDFENAGGVHIEPMGVYSQNYKSLDDLPKKGTIIMSNSVGEHGRILSLLEKEGLIKLKEGVDKTEATVKDISENPKEINFKTDVEAGLLPNIYKNGEGDAVVINTNYAIDAGLDPKKDAIALEGSDSEYVNIIAVNKGHKDDKAIKTLVEVLQSKEIQDFINEEYNGAVVPVKE